MLQVEGIDVYYGDVQVLKNVSLDVKEKELVAVIGANGAGKTTLIRTISGLLKPRKGSILFSDKCISDIHAHQVVAQGVVACGTTKPVTSGATGRHVGCARMYCCRSSQ